MKRVGKPKFLYHGSRAKINVLEVRKPNDPHPDHCKKGVYASSDKIGAIAHVIAPKNSRCFGERGYPVICFVSGWPTSKTHKYGYLHILDSKDFKHNVRNEWISQKAVKPIRIEKYRVSDLKDYWRKSNEEELKEYLNNRVTWRTPGRISKTKQAFLKKNLPNPIKVWELKSD